MSRRVSGGRRPPCKIGIVNPRIAWKRNTDSPNGGSRLPLYSAIYYDKLGHIVVRGQAATAGQALADLYIRLHRRGYDISELPAPEPEQQ